MRCGGTYGLWKVAEAMGTQTKSEENQFKMGAS